VPIGTPYNRNSPRTCRDHARDTEGLEARITAHLITPEMKSDCFESNQITHSQICPVASAYAAPKQKASADGADIFAKKAPSRSLPAIAPPARPPAHKPPAKAWASTPTTQMSKIIWVRSHWVAIDRSVALTPSNPNYRYPKRTAQHAPSRRPDMRHTLGFWDSGGI
jgi:hypothetical protein